jgi:hypothetical protein
MFKAKENILYVKGKCEEALQSCNMALKVAHVQRKCVLHIVPIVLFVYSKWCVILSILVYNFVSYY